MPTAWDSNLIRVVRDKLQKEAARISENILLGKIATWEDYKRLTGELRAITFALETIAKSELELLSPPEERKK